MLLAGGPQFPMGCDRPLLPFRRAGWWISVARAVDLAAGRRGAGGSMPRLYVTSGYAAIPDRYPGTGPLGGIVTALHHSSADWNLVAACDMPELSGDILRLLINTAAEHSGADALVPRGPSGRLEPLCAVYHRRSRPALERALERGDRSVRGALEKAPRCLVAVPEVTPFQNVNTPEEWAVYAAK